VAPESLMKFALKSFDEIPFSASTDIPFDSFWSLGIKSLKDLVRIRSLMREDRDEELEV
jgi:hypothetical protein